MKRTEQNNKSITRNSNLGQSRSSRLNDKKKRKKKTVRMTLLSLAAVFLFIIGFAGVYLHNTLGKIQSVSIDQSDDGLGISDEGRKELDKYDTSKHITNIALFGLDQRNLNEAGRSDSIMILSIDKAHKKIKVTSIMRDTYVNISGRGMNKINAAYALGGPQLAIRTLNENFNLNIQHFVTVNFFSLEKIIDALGGVEIDVKNSEITHINKYTREVAKLDGKQAKQVTTAGMQTLNGMQAVAYSRIRAVGNDFERTERQRRVLTSLFDKIQEAGVVKYPSLVNELLPFVQTSMSRNDILKTGTDVLTSGIKTLEQERFPINGYFTEDRTKWTLNIDIQETKEQMHKFIYMDTKTPPKKK
jgi:polyisoprenyl-teichoic acid--peptidoglycan teichoic acid transferase